MYPYNWAYEPEQKVWLAVDHALPHPYYLPEPEHVWVQDEVNGVGGDDGYGNGGGGALDDFEDA